MKAENKKEFAELMISTAELYGKKVSKELMKLYFDILTDFSINDIKSAIGKHSLDSVHGTFFPKPADIARHINSNQPQVEDKAELAWSVIVGEISRVGSYDNLEMEDKQALSTVRALGGWKNLCSKTYEQLGWLKKEFLAIYTTYEKTPVDMLPSNLPGRIELENYKSQPTKFFKQFKEHKNKQIQAKIANSKTKLI